MRYSTRASFVVALWLAGSADNRTLEQRNPELPRFVAHEIASGLDGGYQTIAVDLNHDGRPDLVALASNLPQLAWYENPNWTRHILADGFSGLINAAAADLDGDGIPEIAVASGFSTTPEKSTGIITLLSHGADPREPWISREIDRVPTAHRLRWFTSAHVPWLINAPLVGETARRPDDRGATPIYFYRPPHWMRERITNDEQGVVHAIEPVSWADPSDRVLLSAGFAGLHRYKWSGQKMSWSREAISIGNPAPWPQGGSSEVAIGHLGTDRFLSAIEPWHGNQVVVYREQQGRWRRDVIDSTVTQGHTLVVVDLNRDGWDELVVGQRGSTRSVQVYQADAAGAHWSRMTLDDDMAAQGCAAGDLNGDGWPDIACIGAMPAKLKWYENTGKR